MIGLAVVCLIGALVSAIVRHLLGHHSQHPAHHLEVSWRRRVPGLAVMLVGVAILVATSAGSRRPTAGSAYLRSPMLVLTGPERRQVVKQVRGDAPVDVEHLPVFREWARRISRQRAVAPLLRGFALVPVGRLLISATPLVIVMIAWFIAGAAYWALWVRFDAKRAESFLARHSA